MGAVAEGGKDKEATKGHLAAKDEPKDSRYQKAACGNEEEGMRELAMELEAQERIGGGPDEDVEVGSEAREEAHPDGETRLLGVAGSGGGQGGPRESLGKWIHWRKVSRKLGVVDGEGRKGNHDRNVEVVVQDKSAYSQGKELEHRHQGRKEYGMRPRQVSP